MDRATLHRHSLRNLAWGASLLLLAAAGGCTRGSRGAVGARGPDAAPTPTDPVLSASEDAPGVHFNVVAITGQSGLDGTFQVGDHVTIEFNVTKDDDTAWDLAELASARALMSGPTFNYQRVLAEQRDLVTASTKLANGNYRYRFADAIPASYLAPVNDTTTFGAGDGELQGQSLLAGTYTIGLYGYWSYTVEDESLRDVGNTTVDVLFGGASTIEPRAVVGQENCNSCHDQLQAHGGTRRDVTLCLLCHTAGAEDRNVSTVEGGTPDVTIDFRVMIHKIHNGEHLPSVQGVGVNPDGSHDYGATPKPYKIVGFNNSVTDFSEVAFPVWPNLNIAMPRDLGYTALSSGEKTQSDAIRTGVTACVKCHGDPDGDGPLSAPADGDRYSTQLSRQSCGACHDDIDWDLPYQGNEFTMPDHSENDACATCHLTTGNEDWVVTSHTHPLLDPDFNTGFNVVVSSVAEGGVVGVDNDDDGTIDPGETIAVTFDCQDDEGNSLDPLDATFPSTISVALSGPTSNYQLLLNTSIPKGALTGAPPYTIKVPTVVALDYAGDAANDAAIETFDATYAPFWNMTSATTTVQLRTATAGGSSTLMADAAAGQNWIEVADATNFAHNDYVVVADGVGGEEEYLRIQQVDGTKLWFGSLASTSYKPGLVFEHLTGVTVKEVTLTTKTVNVDYTVNAANGQISEVGVASFPAGDAVVVSYTTDLVMPSVHGLQLNDSPDLDESWGKWNGKTLVSGTYTLAIWGAISKNLDLWGETNSYRLTSPPANSDFLVGDATDLEPYALVEGAAACNKCHDDLYFHGGGRRGFDTCIACHGAAGGEDRSQYVASNAPATTGVSVNFRTMLHKIHMGAELANASSYTVVGFGSTAWPNNYGTSTYEAVEFPSFPNGPADCVACHGDDAEAWYAPTDRNHPDGQDLPVRAWLATCGACHDSDEAQAHIASQTSASGQESCAVCHGEGRPQDVQVMHKVR